MAFLSEIHYKNSYANGSGNPEFLEVTLSPTEAARAGDFQIATYQSDGTVRSSFTLTDPGVTVTIDAVTGYYVYTVDTRVTDPDHTTGSNEAEAVAFVDNSLVAPANVLSFVDIGGGTTNITATDGPASGATSTNIPAAAGSRSIQWDIWGNRIDGAFTEGTSVTCFVAGTLIATPEGEIPVQDLRVGDLAQTKDHGAQKIRWIGHSHVSKERLKQQPNLRPVCIKSGALSVNDPARDLLVSQQHRMLLSDPMFDLHYGANAFLVKAKDISHSYENAFVVMPDQAVDYFHLFFDQHQIIFANNSPSESFFPGKDALKSLDPAQRDELLALFPQFETSAAQYPVQSFGTLKSWEAAISGQTQTHQ